MGIGDISLIDSFEFDPGRCWDPRPKHVSGNVYVIAYSGVNGAPWGTAGWLATVTIAPDGTIGAIIDTLKFDADDARGPDIIHITGNVWAVIYQHIETGAPFNGVNAITVTIETNGQIGAAITDRLILDAYYFGMGNPRIIHIDGTVYAAVYSGTDSDGYVKTFTIAADGTIGAVIDFLEYETVRSSGQNIIPVSGNVYAIAFQAGDDPWPLRVVTVTIETNGQIGAAVEDTADIAPTIWAGSPDFIHMAGTVYAAVYSHPDGTHSYVKTFPIAADGTIGGVIDTYLFDADSSHSVFIIPIVGEIYAIVYGQRVTNTGIIKTLTLHDDGEIDADPLIDTLEFAAYSRQQRMLYMAGSVYALASRGADEDGFLYTLEFETLPSGMAGLNPAFMEVLGC